VQPQRPTGTSGTPGALEGAKLWRATDGYVQKIDATGANVLYGSYFSQRAAT